MFPTEYGLDTIASGTISAYDPGMTAPDLHSYFTKESIAEAAKCSCNAPWEHQQDTLHKASCALSRSLGELGNAILTSLPRFVSRFFS
jgi:hypothetical protein